MVVLERSVGYDSDGVWGCGRKLGPNSWNEVQVMYTQKEINDVLKIYDRLNSLRGTVRLLG